MARTLVKSESEEGRRGARHRGQAKTADEEGGQGAPRIVSRNMRFFR